MEFAAVARGGLSQGAASPERQDDGRLIAGRYRILEELARGGPGEVYLALDQHLQRKIALKVIRGLGTLDGDIARLDAKIHKRATYRFASTAEQFTRDTTADLVAKLTAFVDPDPKNGLLADVRARLAFAESVERETLVKYEAVWKRATGRSPRAHGRTQCRRREVQGAFRHSCWNVNGLDDIGIAPFHVLERLRQRGLAHKRGLALREFALESRASSASFGANLAPST